MPHSPYTKTKKHTQKKQGGQAPNHPDARFILSQSIVNPELYCNLQVGLQRKQILAGTHGRDKRSQSNKYHDVSCWINEKERAAIATRIRKNWCVGTESTSIDYSIQVYSHKNIFRTQDRQI